MYKNLDIPETVFEQKKKNKNLYTSYTFIDTEKNIHKRQVYNCFDLMGDMGGVLEVMIFALGIFIIPAKE